MIITIDGVAGAGKTTLAKFMSEEYQHRASVHVVHMDDLYEGWENPLGPALTSKLEKIVEAHHRGTSCEVEGYDWSSMEASKLLAIPSVEMLILEGVGSGQSSIRDFAETKIWIDLEPIVGLRRVLARDGFGIESEMLRFMDQQRDHFIAQGTRDAADFHLAGL